MAKAKIDERKAYFNSCLTQEFTYVATPIIYRKTLEEREEALQEYWPRHPRTPLNHPITIPNQDNYVEALLNRRTDARFEDYLDKLDNWLTKRDQHNFPDRVHPVLRECNRVVVKALKGEDSESVPAPPVTSSIALILSKNKTNRWITRADYEPEELPPIQEERRRNLEREVEAERQERQKEYDNIPRSSNSAGSGYQADQESRGSGSSVADSNISNRPCYTGSFSTSSTQSKPKGTPEGEGNSSLGTTPGTPQGTTPRTSQESEQADSETGYEIVDVTEPQPEEGGGANIASTNYRSIPKSQSLQYSESGYSEQDLFDHASPADIENYKKQFVHKPLAVYKRPSFYHPIATPPQEPNTVPVTTVEEEAITEVKEGPLVITEDQTAIEIEKVRRDIERLGEQIGATNHQNKKEKHNIAVGGSEVTKPKEQENLELPSEKKEEIKEEEKEVTRTALATAELKQATEDFLEVLIDGEEASDAAFQQFRSKFLALNSEIESAIQEPAL